MRFFSTLNDDVCNLISAAKCSNFFVLWMKKVSRLHETFLWVPCKWKVYRSLWSQGACFAYLILSVNNLLIQLTFGDSTHPAKIYCRVMRCVSIFRCDLSLLFTFEISCFPVDFVSWFHAKKNVLFVIGTVNVEWTGKWMIYLHFTLSWVLRREKVFHKLCGRFSARNVEMSILRDRQCWKK